MLKSRMLIAPQFHVIIPAAGAGSRMQADMPKQYLSLLERPVIDYVLKVFKASPRIRSITVALSAEDAHWDAYDLNTDAGINVLRCGSTTRALTVLNALQQLEGKISENDWVLVHDAARPGLSLSLLDKLLDELQHDQIGGLLAVPLADTLKRADSEQRVASTEPREHLWQAQTPQMFRYGMLKQALTAAQGQPTDEAQAIEALGYKPKLVAGELRNLKITYPQDLALAAAILRTI